MQECVPVVLCGGSGTRLWPKSRKALPKPFLPLVGDETLFSATLARCASDLGFGHPIVVTGTAHLEHVQAQVCAPATTRIIVEPEERNTAAAIALAALSLSPEAVMLVCPSDHHIGDSNAFRQAAIEAAHLARDGWLVSLGIVPTAPETGFGYLKQGDPIAGTTGYSVDKFVEKPEYALAQQFLLSGEYAWNGGIFAFRAGTFLDELGKYRPEILDCVKAAVAHGQSDGNRFFPDAESFSRIKGESVDFAVMENTNKAAMVPVSMAWSDIGNWQSLRDALEADVDGNVQRGKTELRDCHNVFAMTDGPRISVVGASDLIIVVDRGEVLITTPEGAQLVGKLSGAVNQ